ncbi:MAG: UvrD-helicase domain-containing protein, partial [Victivallales bacterium]|nr:UvrD-helicase domain-containing protein [Victivallales bacterium]
QGIPITEILVVTFTELATAELRDRLRRILSETLNACLQFATDGSLPESNKQILPFFDATRCPEAITENNVEDILKRLKAAQQSFDDAPVSTIHGFCSRMLNENAFESGLRYGMKPRTDVSDLIFKALNDFCRQECYLPKGDTNDKSNAIRAMQEAVGCRPDILQSALSPLLSGGKAIPNWGDYDWCNQKTSTDTISKRRTELEAEFPLLFDQLIDIKSLKGCLPADVLNQEGRDFFGGDNLVILSELFRVRHPKAAVEIARAYDRMTSKKERWFKKKIADQALTIIMAQPVMEAVAKFKAIFDEYGQIIKNSPMISY